MSAVTPSVRLGPLGQIALSVNDVPRATAFYRDALGLPLLFEVSGMAFLNCGGIRLMLARPEGQGAPANGSTVLYYLVDDIHAAHAALGERGVDFKGAPQMVARLPDHELWLAFFGDGEGNLGALMAEVR